MGFEQVGNSEALPGGLWFGVHDRCESVWSDPFQVVVGESDGSPAGEGFGAVVGSTKWFEVARAGGSAFVEGAAMVEIAALGLPGAAGESAGDGAGDDVIGYGGGWTVDGAAVVQCCAAGRVGPRSPAAHGIRATCFGAVTRGAVIELSGSGSGSGSDAVRFGSAVFVAGGIGAGWSRRPGKPIR